MKWSSRKIGQNQQKTWIFVCISIDWQETFFINVINKKYVIKDQINLVMFCNKAFPDRKLSRLLVLSNLAYFVYSNFTY